jgi:putative DNA primase/helicase
MFEDFLDRGNDLLSPENVKELAKLKHSDEPGFFSFLDALTAQFKQDKTKFGRVSELKKRVEQCQKAAKVAGKKKKTFKPESLDGEESTEIDFGEITQTRGGDANNGIAFAQRYRGWLLHVDAAKTWLWFNGVYWQRCSGSFLERQAKAVLKIILNKSMDRLKINPKDSDAENALKAALSAQKSVNRIKAIVEAARSERGMSVPNASYFDKDPWLLGVRNGVLDLRTGKLLDPAAGYYISKVAGAEYQEDATCTLWLKTLDGIFQGNAELIRLVQTLAGYSLCGIVDEEIFIFLYGEGANGKTTFMNVIQAVLHDYVGALSSRVVVKGQGGEGEVRLAKAHSVGLRLLWVNETAEGDVFDDDVVKQFSSRDPICGARNHYEQSFDFIPTHTLWIRSNHKPGVTDSTHAFWRRMLPIPFNATFEGKAVRKSLDRTILETEAAGVLNWMLEGCLTWQRDGSLILPDCVKRDRIKYQEQTDIFKDWERTHCTVGPNNEVSLASLLGSYNDYLREQNMKTISGPAFGRMLDKRGFESRHGRRGKMITGIKVNDFPVAGGDDVTE